MDSNQTIHMNQGEGETSYAVNSIFQNAEQTRLKPVIEEAVVSLLESATTSLPNNSMAIADLGCSSGPNAIGLVSTVVNAIRRHHGSQHEQPTPEVRVFLNDLPDNDFNTVAKMLVAFKEAHEASGSAMVTAMVPGSFYTRLFASQSLHLVCSSSSVHWLSKSPEDLVKNRIPAYDGDDDLRRARQPIVFEAYRRQFHSDFTLFLSLRSQELVPGGRMVLSLMGTRHDDLATRSIHSLERVNFILNDMASRGVIDRERFDSFYIPLFGPSEKELRETIEQEGSFEVNKIQVRESMSSMTNELMLNNPRIIANGTRAVVEPIILQHFGRSEEIMDEFVRTLEKDIMRNPMYVAEEEDPRAYISVYLSRRI